LHKYLCGKHYNSYFTILRKVDIQGRNYLSQDDMGNEELGFELRVL
jgi:hypothetical protein